LNIYNENRKNLSKQNKNEVIILGGGLAGLSAAVCAINAGFRPIILEKNKYLGGRVRSFYAADIQNQIDNGQHVISYAYIETLKFLDKISKQKGIVFPQNFSTLFYKNKYEKIVYRTMPLPAPFHFFVPLMLKKNFTKTKIFEYFKFIQKDLKIRKDMLEKLTVSEWLDKCNQNQDIREILWKPLTLSILNTSIDKASAFLLKGAISRSFLHSRKNSRLGLPTTWLSEIFAYPAEKYIRQNNGHINLLNTVVKFIVNNKNIESVITKNNQYDAPWIISTVPPYALEKIIGTSNNDSLADFFSNLKKFNYNPIITINIYLDKPIEGSLPAAFISSPLHWIFQHPHGSKTQKTYGYTIVISSANDWVLKSREEILTMVKLELQKLVGIDFEKSHNIIQDKIIKEKRATISQTPSSLSWRPYTKTPINNFFLAGDWTSTGIPATIESAILSGKIAVKAILKTVGKESAE
jgi:squalene-associated FAD-dependent desaturase